MQTGADRSVAVQAPANTMIEARSLYRSFGARVAVAGVSFCVQRGEIFGALVHIR
jgi:ABC-type transporter Mla maintaining outer membrane lipid asymmetry ATPase subunit MlaF